MLSESTEMYLITVYRLTDGGRPFALITELANMLGIKHSSASEKVKRLTEQGYLLHDQREGVALTDEGRRIAISVLRKHRLIKTYMVNLGGYSLDEVYDEACRLEHAITDRFADSLERLLNYPEVDPHGYPIPTRDGQIAQLSYASLNDFSPGDVVIVRRIEALNQEKLTYLRELGLVPGAAVTIVSIAPFDGPLMLRVADRPNPIHIAPSLAQEVEVSPAPGGGEAGWG
ncbi:MAG: iron-dependent repressor [Chloroflexota bacterium]|nr:MAG: iron-dependent repressor [Chloroflexota bacterium]